MRNRERLARIRKLGCCVDNCSLPSVAAHSNFGMHGKGFGIKASDEYVIPMCVKHHFLFDTYQLGMDRNESLEWFLVKLAETNKRLAWQKRELEQNGVDF